MWHVAFSSNNVSKNVTPSWPTRELAQTPRSLVCFELGAHDVLTAARLRLHDLPGFEAQLEPFDDRSSCEAQRPRCANRPFGSARVRRREHLLGRHVREMATTFVRHE